MAKHLHIFAGSFPSRDAACLYTEAQWEPEPDDSVSDEEYAAWEDRNPVWPLRKELDVYLDSDFIETIDGEKRFDYVGGYLTNDDDLALVREAASEANILVLIFPDALGGFDAELKSTSQLHYCGGFPFSFG